MHTGKVCWQKYHWQWKMIDRLCSCLGHLGQYNTDRIISICVVSLKVAKSSMVVLLLLAFLPLKILPCNYSFKLAKILHTIAILFCIFLLKIVQYDRWILSKRAIKFLYGIDTIYGILPTSIEVSVHFGSKIIQYGLWVGLRLKILPLEAQKCLLASYRLLPFM